MSLTSFLNTPSLPFEKVPNVLELGLPEPAMDGELESMLSAVESLEMYMDSVLRISALENENEQKIALSCLFASVSLESFENQTVEVALEGIWTNIVSAFVLSFKNLGVLFTNMFDSVGQQQGYAANLIDELNKRGGEPKNKTINLSGFGYQNFLNARKGIYANTKEAIKEVNALMADPLSQASSEFVGKVEKGASDKSGKFWGTFILGAYYLMWKHLTTKNEDIDVESLDTLKTRTKQDADQLGVFKGLIKDFQDIAKKGVDESQLDKMKFDTDAERNEARKTFSRNTKAGIKIMKKVMATSIDVNRDSLNVSYKMMKEYPAK